MWRALPLLACSLLHSAALASPDLARQKNCLNCHQAERKIVGPAWRDIAQRYGKTPNAAAALAVKIRAGGSGAWGVVPMPANASVNAVEAQQLAEWVLTHK